LAGSATENVTKLSFASERMQAAGCAHYFVDFCFQTTSTVNEVSRCRSPLRYLPSSLLCWMLRRWDVEQSPFTVVEIDLCGWRPPMLTKPHVLLCSFSLTGMIFVLICSRFTRIQSSRSQYGTSPVLTTFHAVFYLNFYWRLASKSLHIHQTSPDWSHCRDVTRRS